MNLLCDFYCVNWIYYLIRWKRVSEKNWFRSIASQKNLYWRRTGGERGDLSRSRAASTAVNSQQVCARLPDWIIDASAGGAFESGAAAAAAAAPHRGGAPSRPPAAGPSPRSQPAALGAPSPRIPRSTRAPSPPATPPAPQVSPAFVSRPRPPPLALPNVKIHDVALHTPISRLRLREFRDSFGGFVLSSACPSATCEFSTKMSRSDSLSLRLCLHCRRNLATLPSQIVHNFFWTHEFSYARRKSNAHICIFELEKSSNKIVASLTVDFVTVPADSTTLSDNRLICVTVKLWMAASLRCRKHKSVCGGAKIFRFRNRQISTPSGSVVCIAMLTPRIGFTFSFVNFHENVCFRHTATSLFIQFRSNLIGFVLVTNSNLWHV